MHGLLGLDMLFLKLVSQFFEHFKLLNGKPHFLDFLIEYVSTSSSDLASRPTHLAKLKIPLRQLNQHLFSTESIVELLLEVLDLHVGSVKLVKSRLVLG